MTREERIVEIHRFLSGELTNEDLEQFLEWRKADPANDAVVREYEEAWNAAEGYRTPDFDSEAAIRQLDLSPRPAGRRLPRWLARAAMLALLVTAGWFLFGEDLMQPTWTVANATDTPTLNLADGSAVFLNDGASLQYPESFNRKERRVRLQGEAFFTVAGKEHPFVIDAGIAEVTVLGTEFGVEINEYEQEITVRVAEGLVRLQPDGSDLYLDVAAGQAAGFNATTGALQMLKQPDLNALSWHTKTLSFVRTPVTEVIEDLAETFGVQVDLRQSGIQNCTYTSPQPFKNASAEQVLEAMSVVFQARVTSPEEGYYLIVGGSCE